MQKNEWIKGDYFISTDIALLNISYIQNYLSQHSYWAEGIPYEIVERSIQNSICFGVYKAQQQIGFARVITDKTTFAYLADVFIDEQYRGLGLSKWLMKIMMDYPEFQNLRNWMLVTKDAHGLYEQFGFLVHPQPERVMRKNNFITYLQKDQTP